MSKNKSIVPESIKSNETNRSIGPDLKKRRVLDERRFDQSIGSVDRFVSERSLSRDPTISPCHHKHVTVKKNYEPERTSREFVLTALKFALVECGDCKHVFKAKKNKGVVSGIEYTNWIEIIVDDEKCDHRYFKVKRKSVTEHSSGSDIDFTAGMLFRLLTSGRAKRWKEGHGRCILCDKTLAILNFYEPGQDRLKGWFLEKDQEGKFIYV